ncbi:MAG: ATP-binding cassette domain-containing protein, partial [Balneolaceae bacterium]|nr:ATP-binding cassette domain-containing protein [Balneolaceae bacterium]
MLQLNNISKSFGSNRVLNDISFSAESGKTLSILGRSGCGKTTLLKTVAGILEPDRGNVTLNGKDVHAMVPFKREIVYLYQET